MSTVRKYANLPDLDAAPDIYETPELTDDASTHPTSTALRSESPESTYHDPESDEASGIDRHGIDADEARTHFLPNGEKAPDQSNRIISKRRTYRSSSRKRRKDAPEINGLINGVEVSSDEEEESLDRKLSRLRKEVAEVKGEFERRKANRISGVAQEPQDETDSLDTLSQVLDSVGQSSADSEFSAANRLAIRLKTLPKVSRIVAAEKVTEQSEQNAANSTYTVSYAPQYQEDYAISKVSDFDSRLTLIEAALGIDAIPLPTQDRTNSKAVIPTLDSLDKQLVTLSTSTESSLDKVSRRVRQLTQDAEKLEQARRAAKAAQEALSPADDDPPWLNTGAKDVEISEDTEQRAKINALYGTLTTIESLAPLLPSVLDRLRSLRSLHADAATASQTLAEVQSRQEDMRQELQGWREGLEKVEKAMEHGEQTMKENTRTVEGWVKELEERLQKLGS